MDRLTRLLLIAGVLGCGGGDAEPDAAPAPGMVRIELRNNTPGSSALWHAYSGNDTPDQFAVKLIAVSLTDPLDPGAENVPQRVYLHPDCAEAAGCAIADFLEILRPSAEVNAELAAATYPVAAGSYSRVQLHWRPDDTAAINARYRMDTWQAGVTKELSWGATPVIDAMLLAPIEIAAGAMVRLSLAYDLDRLVLHNMSIDGCAPTNDPTCYSEGQDRWFIAGDPEFAAAALRDE
ncbi:MAG TPA: hypothetical protein VML75_18980 [Kofleriaceae bacterium]|nr:hypothetical protein [Kofleriaceae bacterium]